MGNTATYAFPYPDKTNPRTAPADLKALADAIDAELANRPWWAFARWTTGTIGTAADVVMTGWDVTELNFSIGSPSPAGGIVVPKAGMYLVTVDCTFIATWSGGPQMNIGAKTTAGRETLLSRNEPGSTGGQRRSYSVTGMLRAAAGETISGFMNNGGGTGTVTFAGDTSPGGRWSSRFNGMWIAP